VIDGNVINQNTYIKYLGVLIDDTLNWGPYMLQIS